MMIKFETHILCFVYAGNLCAQLGKSSIKNPYQYFGFLPFPTWPE